MATPAPIYISSPGLLLSKNATDTQVVLLPPASTIGSQVIVRDASGTASAAYPIIISTAGGAFFKGGLSTFYISEPYGACAAAALRPTLYIPLYASTFAPSTRYGTESNFTPQHQYISSAYTPATFRSLQGTTLQGTLVNGLSAFAPPSPFTLASLSTGAISTGVLTVGSRFNGGNVQTLSSYSDYLSAGLGVFSTTNLGTLNVAGATVLQSTLRSGGGLTVAGTGALAGSAVFADVSANGYWSTLGTIGIGGDVSGYSFLAGGSASMLGAVYGSNALYVSSGFVGATLSSVMEYASTGVYSGGLGVGVRPGVGLGAMLDVSGGGLISGSVTAPGISTLTVSTAAVRMSAAQLRDIAVPANTYGLNVSGGYLYLGTTQLGAPGAQQSNFVGNTYTINNYLYSQSTVVSTITIGSNYVNPDFNLAVYGTAHTSSARSTLFLAGGYASSALGSAPLSGPSLRSAVKYSWDGLNWSNINTGGSEICNDIAYNGRMWVGGFGITNTNFSGLNIRSTIQWSLDGSNWSNSITGGFFGWALWGTGNISDTNSIAWNGRMWIATGTCCNITDYRCTIQVSYDGSNWTNCLSATGFATSSADTTPSVFYGNRTYRPTWNGRMWIAGRLTALDTNNACYSYDGLNWSNLGIACGGGPVVSVGWNGRYWIAGGSNCISLSSNGFTWTSNNSSPINNMVHITDIKWDGIKWLAVGQSNLSAIIYSYNGLNWFPASGVTFSSNNNAAKNSISLLNTYQGAQSGARKVIWTGNTWYAAGGVLNNVTGTSNATIQYSRNGINWSNITSGGFGCNAYANAGSGITYTGMTIAWQSNVNNDLLYGTGLNFQSQAQQLPFTSSHNYVHNLSTSISFNQTLFVDSQKQIAINSVYSTNTTTYTLYVDGSMFTYGAAKAGAGGTWTAPSDQRVKEDIQNADISACYHIVRNLHVHNYKFKDEYVAKYKLPSRPRYGLYAEEVARVLPEAVVETDVLGENILMLDMEPVYMTHYGASSYLYSTLKHQTSTIAGGNTYITAAGPLNDISTILHTKNITTPSIQDTLNQLYAAHQSNYQ